MNDAGAGAGESSAAFVVGIDLGTTNSAVAWAEPARSPRIGTFPIPQLVAEGEVGAWDSLPSAVYLAGEHDVPAGALGLPWREDQRYAVGRLARRLGVRVAGRLVTSAKSWLSHAGVDRTARILPWGAGPEISRLSPVDVSARILEHVREAWDAAHPAHPLAEQDVVLTVPASFDEVARELTVTAAIAAGLPRVRLLEEPQAAIYAWIASRAAWREDLAGRSLVLVVDVGGGTTDFSLIAVKRGVAGLELERVAVGEHLLLGGDNMDLALARHVASTHGEAASLDAARWQQLVDLCREAKERLLGDDPPADIPLSLAGRGRGIVAGAIRATLTAADVERTVRDGFFPLVAADARPRDRHDLALAEFGLPFAAEPEISRHLAEFLARSAERGGGAGAAPDAILFNGGALKPRAIRERLLEMLGGWSGSRPAELAGADLDLAVSRGAVAYGLARRGIGVRIGGGAARAYYVGLDAGRRVDDPDPTGAGADRPLHLLCIAPRGMEEGEAIEIRSSEFEVIANTPVRFPIYASASRGDEAGGAIVVADPASVVELPPIATVLRFGRALQARTIPVHLRSQLSETGTLELWCTSRSTDHRWRMAFDLRGTRTPAVRAPADVDAGAAPDETAKAMPPSPAGAEAGRAPADASEMVVADGRVATACALLEACFGDSRPGADPVRLTRELEEVLGSGKDGWPLDCIRRLWDALFALESGRGRTAAHEARWLNLAGFLLRPGFGEARDPWRAEQIWRLFDRGLVSPGATQARAEWWTLWKRVAGGLSRQQQQALFQEIRPILLPDAKRKGKPGRWKGGPQEIREMWQVAGTLERLAAGTKLEMARALAPRVSSGKSSDAELWAFGRLLARAPVHGPANTVIEPAHLVPWLEALAAAPWERPAATALVVAQAARLTGDRVRDVDAELRARLAARLESEQEGRRLARWLRERISMDAREQALVLAESLPVGIRLAGDVPPADPLTS